MKYSTQRRIHVMILSGRLSPFPVGVRSVEDRTQDQKPFSGLANSSKKGTTISQNRKVVRVFEVSILMLNQTISFSLVHSRYVAKRD